MVCLRPEGASLLRPIDSDTLRLGWQPDLQPNEVVVDGVCRYGLAPILVHSTSWRLESGRVVLTYVTAVEAPSTLNEHLQEEPIARSDLARGGALGQAPEIGTHQVVEHAFRHLAWLVKDDNAVREAIPDWASFLEGYEPEPFRAFGTPAGR